MVGSFWVAALILAAGAGQAGVEMPRGMSRVAGVDAQSGIAYALISVDGKVVGAEVSGAAPRLTGVCTRDAGGKLKFELMMDGGGGGPLAFVPPWKPSKEELFEPQPVMVNVAMEFLGYTKVKPVKRQWGYLKGLPDQLKYGTPGLYSSNLEQVAYYMQYLRSLPTVRLTVPGKLVVEFETLAWQGVLRAEPMCRASGL